MQKTAYQKALDNRANQLNPNNPLYVKSRMGNIPKKNSPKKNNTSQHKPLPHDKTHGPTRECPICGGTGKFSAAYNSLIFHRTKLRCGHCGGVFHVDW